MLLQYRLIILRDAYRPRQALRTDIQTRKREAASKRMDLLPKLLDRLRALGLAGCDAHEVLQELGTRFLLNLERELHGAVEELRDLLVILLKHVT